MHKRFSIIILTNLHFLQIARTQEEAETASKRYNLIISGLRKKRRLERPGHLEALVTAFLTDRLGLMVTLYRIYRTTVHTDCQETKSV